MRKSFFKMDSISEIDYDIFRLCCERSDVRRYVVEELDIQPVWAGFEERIILFIRGMTFDDKIGILLQFSTILKK